MTYYEAALEVLRAAGEPMHFEAITAAALEKDLLSHTGRLPESVMRSRLAAMASREPPGELVATEAGIFGLASWGLTHVPEAVEEILSPDRGEGPPLRGPERNPMPLKEARLASEAERTGRWDTIEKQARARSRRRRRRAREGETQIEALVALVREVGGGPIDLLYIADAIPRQENLPEGFPTDIDGLRTLAAADTERALAAGLAGTFELEGDRITLRPPLNDAGPPEDPRPRRNEEQSRQAVRQLVPFLRKLHGDELEGVVRALGMRMGLEGFRTASRAADGSPLFTAKVAFGAARIRIAIRVDHGSGDLRVDDIEQLRAEQAGNGASIGVLVSRGKASSAARAQAEDASRPTVLILDGTALAELCLKLGVGVRYAYEERVTVDETALRLFRGDEE
ncbi:MAG: HTH domain-containing protein [Deltaproteobacteria bacterium]|nr:HTH domain-containing protein [Deltaproteobacteria bacterium]